MEPSNAQKYEKQFLDKYFKAQATKKIAKVDAKLHSCSNDAQRKKLEREKEAIQKELDEFLLEIQEDEKQAFVQTEKSSFVHGDYKYDKYTITDELWNKLFKYQQEGVKWMLDLYSKGQGGIIADEMGLGKTIQTIAFIVAISSGGVTNPIFVVCPATLVNYWINELRIHAPNLEIGNYKSKHLCTVVVLSYEKFRTLKIRETVQALILDEGHKIKNKDAGITLAAKAFRAKHKFILTGTPIQNNLSELWSLIDFVFPGLLGSYTTFKEEYEENIQNKREPELSYRYSTMLRAIIEPHILRRMKSGIAKELPAKFDHVLFLPLSPLQEELYIAAIESKYVKNAMENKGALLGAIDYLRKICNHPLLVRSENANLIESSCKMAALFEMLEKWEDEPGQTLIFTQTVQMQRILEKAICSYGFPYLKMSGEVSVHKRDELVRKFKEDNKIKIFLLTTRVGGLGLNLTTANRIVLFDPDWNPSVDNQAKERVHRYGQNRHVSTFRLICKNTIEEKVYQRQIYKDCLSKKILTNPRISFKKESFIDLFEYRRGAGDEAELKPYENAIPETDVLQQVRDEDRANFEVLKKMGSAKVLTGKELIHFIERREMSL